MAIVGWKEIKERVEEEEKFLDTLDLLPLIKDATSKGLSIPDIVRLVEDTYIDEYNKVNPDAEFILNYMSNSEFCDYICKRYNITYREEITEYFNC